MISMFIYIQKHVTAIGVNPMENIRCPVGHTDTFVIPQDELKDLKKKGLVEQEVYALLGCDVCEDFYELLLIPVHKAGQ